LFFAMITLGAVSFSGAGVAVAVSLFYMAFAPVYSYRIFHKVGVSRADVAGIYLPPLAFAALAALSAHLLGGLVSSGDLARTVVIGLSGSALYLALLRLFAPQIFTQLLARVRILAEKRIHRVATVSHTS